MNHPVILLVLAGKLVLLDLALGIVISMGAEDQSVLCPSVHCLGIDIVARLGILNQPAAALPVCEILHSPVIHTLVVVGKNRVEVNLRLRDMKQGFLTGLPEGLF